MDDAHAPQPRSSRRREKLRHQRPRFNRRETVQVELVLNHPAAAPQLLQYIAADTFAQEVELLAGFEAAFPCVRVGKAVDERLPLVAQTLLRDRLREHTLEASAVCER